MNTQSGIYEILNTVNGKRYIGSAASFKKRWKKHKADLRGRTHHSRKLQNAWNKYGEAAFEFRVLLICTPVKEQLLMYEDLCFAGFNPEYNIQPKAGSPLGQKRTPEFCAGITEMNKGNKYAVGNKNSLGYHHTEDACARISAASTGNQRAKGYRHTPEVIEIIRATSTGRRRSAASIAKTVAIRTGTKHKPESIEKMRVSHMGFRHTPESIERCRVASAGRRHSEETKALLSLRATAQHAARRALKAAA